MTVTPGRYTLPLNPQPMQERPSPDNARTPALPNAGTPSIDLERYDRKWLNVPYARESASHQLDLYLPDGSGGAYPLILLIHGGDPDMDDKQDARLLTILASAIRHGFAAATMNYRTAEEARFPAAVQDVKAAVRFLRTHALSFMLDPNRFALWGFSTGGNLAALAGVTGRMSVFVDAALGNPDTPGDVSAVVDFYGPIDLTRMDAQFVMNGLTAEQRDGANALDRRYLGAPAASVPWLALESDPQTYLTQGIPPFFIAHGTQDLIVPYQQSVQFAAHLNMYRPADDIALRLVDGAGHGGSAFASASMLQQVFDFLDMYLMRP